MKRDPMNVVRMLVRYGGLLALVGGALGATWRGVSLAYDNTVAKRVTKLEHHAAIDSVRHEMRSSVDSVHAELHELTGITLDVLCASQPNHWRCRPNARP
jgi:hypothetical protein